MKKRIVSLLTALVLCLGMLPATALAGEGVVVATVKVGDTMKEYTAESSENDAKLAAFKEAWDACNGSTATLTLKQNVSMDVSSSQQLKITGGTITLCMDEGVTLSCSIVNSSSGAVYIAGGSLDFQSGTIKITTNNTAGSSAVQVYSAYASTSATFTLSGGAIEVANSTTQANSRPSGVRVDRGKFYMTGGSITGTTDYVDGVSIGTNDVTVTISGGTIQNLKGKWYGNCINMSTSTKCTLTISGNAQMSSSSNAFAVDISGSNTTCTISDNVQISGSGGGIRVRDGSTVNISGQAEIGATGSSNHGVNVENGTLNVSGDVQISSTGTSGCGIHMENEDSNTVNLIGNVRVTSTGSSSSGIRMENGTLNIGGDVSISGGKFGLEMHISNATVQLSGGTYISETGNAASPYQGAEEKTLATLLKSGYIFYEVDGAEKHAVDSKETTTGSGTFTIEGELAITGAEAVPNGNNSASLSATVIINNESSTLDTVAGTKVYYGTDMVGFLTDNYDTNKSVEVDSNGEVKIDLSGLQPNQWYTYYLIAVKEVGGTTYYSTAKEVSFYTATASLTGSVAITGEEQYGQTLTATASGLPPDAGTLTYTWYRCDDAEGTNPVKIVSSTNNTYTLTAADIGKYIQVEVRAVYYYGSVASGYTYSVKQAVLTVASVTAENRVYDGTKAVETTGVTLDGILNGDDVGVDISDLTGTLSSANAGTYQQVTLTGTLDLTGTAAQYYTLTQPSAAVSINNGKGVTISKRPVTLDWGITSFTYDGSEHTVTASIANTVAGDTVTPVYNGTTTATNVGNYTATVTGLTGSSADNYTLENVDNTEQNWSIAKAGSSLSLTVDDDYPIYGDTITFTVTPQAGSANGLSLFAAQENTVTFSVGEKVLGSIEVTEGDKGTFTYNTTDKTLQIGANTVTATYTGGGNLNGVTETITVTVEKKLLAVQVADIPSKVYDGSQNVTETLQLSLDGIISGDTVQATYTSAAYNSPDVEEDKTVTISGISLTGTDAGWYAVDSTTSTSGTITKADPTVTAPTQNSLTYTGQAQTLVTAGATTGGTLQYSLTENGTYSTTIPTGTDAGNYTVWYKVVGDANYNDTAANSVSVSIAKATPTVTGVTVSSPETIYTSTNISTIRLTHASTDTPGTVMLDANQSLTAGPNSYAWTFTPTDTQNYNNAAGSISLDVAAVGLESIEITKAPDKTTYYEEEVFDSTGMVVTATYSDGNVKTVTNYTYTPLGGLGKDVTKITVSYTEDGVTKTAEQEITVTALEILGYYADENDTALTTTASVAYGTSESDALAKLSGIGYAKLNNGQYYPVTIQWDFDSTYDGSVSGTKAVTGTVTGELPAGLIPEKQSGTITMERSSNADLSNLTISAGSLTFASGTTTYTVNVPQDTTEVTLTPTAADPKATITVNGSAVESGKQSGRIQLTGPSTAVSIVVTAEDGTTIKTYTVYVKVQSGIKTLTINGTQFVVNYNNRYDNSIPGITFDPLTDTVTMDGVEFNLLQFTLEGTVTITFAESSPSKITGIPALDGSDGFYTVTIDGGGEMTITGEISGTTFHSIKTYTGSGWFTQGETDYRFESKIVVTIDFVFPGSGSNPFDVEYDVDFGGIVYENHKGLVYGNYTLTGNSTIEAEDTLTVPEGTTLTNNDTLTNQGTLVIYSTDSILGNGTISGTDNKILQADPDDLEITVPENAVYDGKTDYARKVTLGLKEPITIQGANFTYDISGWAQNLTKDEAAVEQAINAGTYSVTYTKGEQTVGPKDLTVKKADPTVSSVAVSSPQTIYITTNIGDITLTHADTDTPGTVALVEGQALALGTQDYQWTFTPEDTGNYNAASGTMELTVCKLAAEPPLATEAVIDYEAETISFDAGKYEMASKQDGTGASIASGSSITGYISDNEAATIYIRTRETETHQASAWAAVTIPQRPAAPDGVAGTDPTDSGGTGTITGVKVGQEYRAREDTAWTEVEAVPLSVMPGTYLIRDKASNDAKKFASQPAEVTVGDYVPSGSADLLSLTVSPGTLSPAFDSGTTAYTVTVPYGTETVSVTPTAKDTRAAIEVNGAAVASGTPSGEISLTSGSTIRIVVTAEDGITEKTYTVTIAVAEQGKEPVPAAQIDYEAEKLTGLVAGGAYLIGGAEVAADGEGNVSIPDDWMGTALSIVKKGGGITADSNAQSLDIPQRPAAPAVSGTNESHPGAGDGKITGLDGSLEFSTDQINWTAVTGTESPAWAQAPTTCARLPAMKIKTLPASLRWSIWGAVR